MSKGNIINLHRQMARDALREADRRKAGRKPVGLSDRAVEYLTRQNPFAFIRRSAVDPVRQAWMRKKISADEKKVLDTSFEGE